MILTLLLSAGVATCQPASAEPSAPGAAKEASGSADPAKPLVPYPHPLITEVLYAVPTGEIGDANKDGMRQVAGDEFVELVNPHEKPINLGGYSLCDMTSMEKTSSGKPKSGAIKWTFPPVTIKPGQVVVVFNGHASTIAGAVGDSSAAPAQASEQFGGALVFSMRQPNERIAFSNTGDWVLLVASDGKPVHLVKWGETRIKAPADVPLVEEAPTARNGSVQRTASNSPLAVHPTDGRVSFSPGVFVMPKPEKTDTTSTPQPTPQPSPEAVKPDESGKTPQNEPATVPKKPKF